MSGWPGRKQHAKYHFSFSIVFFLSPPFNFFFLLLTRPTMAVILLRPRSYLLSCLPLPLPLGLGLFGELSASSLCNVPSLVVPAGRQARQQQRHEGHRGRCGYGGVRPAAGGAGVGGGVCVLDCWPAWGTRTTQRVFPEAERRMRVG